jgi:hypothetical protein
MQIVLDNAGDIEVSLGIRNGRELEQLGWTKQQDRSQGRRNKHRCLLSNVDNRGRRRQNGREGKHRRTHWRNHWRNHLGSNAG